MAINAVAPAGGWSPGHLRDDYRGSGTNVGPTYVGTKQLVGRHPDRGGDHLAGHACILNRSRYRRYRSPLTGPHRIAIPIATSVTICTTRWVKTGRSGCGVVSGKDWCHAPGSSSRPFRAVGRCRSAEDLGLLRFELCHRDGALPRTMSTRSRTDTSRARRCSALVRLS
jgi:hypothetical protein